MTACASVLRIVSGGVVGAILTGVGIYVYYVTHRPHDGTTPPTTP